MDKTSRRNSGCDSPSRAVRIGELGPMWNARRPSITRSTYRLTAAARNADLIRLDRETEQDFAKICSANAEHFSSRFIRPSCGGGQASPAHVNRLYTRPKERT